MLLSVFLLISIAVPVAGCLASGSFFGFSWIWQLPLGFAGTFLSVFALWFVLLVIMGAAVDLQKKQESDSKFYRFVMQKTIDMLLPLLGVRIHTKGFEQKLPEGRFLLVSNHLHEIDPAILLHCFPNSQLGFVGKREVAEMFLAGPFLKKTMGQFVNRENDREALKSILECIQIIKEDKASVAVFPEGYIRPDRLMRPFRPGVFKIAQRTKVPVVVCTLQGTHKALGTVMKLQGADVHLHLVGIISAEEVEGASTVEIAEKAYAMMAEDLGPDLVYPLENAENT